MPTLLPFPGRTTTVARLSPFFLPRSCLLLMACAEPTRPVVPQQSRQTLQEAIVDFENRDIETEFVALERMLPGFGGFFHDENGDIVAYVRDGEAGAARQLIDQAFLSDENSRNRFIKRDGGVPEIHVVPGDYTMSELIRWTLAMRSASGVEHGLTLFDADEKRNRVRLVSRHACSVVI